MFRIIGYPELFGRSLAAVGGAEHTISEPPDSPGVSTYFHGEQPYGLHGCVIVGLGHGRGDLVPLGTVESVVEAYGALGYRLTPRGEALARVSQRCQHEGVPWGTALAIARREALAVASDDADRLLGDLTVVTTLDHLTRHHGADVRTQPADMNDPSWLYLQGKPFSVLAYAFGLWGITAADVGELDGLMAVDVLDRLGWQVSARAAAVLASTQLCECAGHTWGEIAHMMATLHTSLDAATELDR